MYRLALVALILTGCAIDKTASVTGPMGNTVAMQSKKSIVITAKVEHIELRETATKYRMLPPCTKTATTKCSDPVILTQLQKADRAAILAVEAAEYAIRNPQVGSHVQDLALASAKSALAALSALVSNLER